MFCYVYLIWKHTVGHCVRDRWVTLCPTQQFVHMAFFRANVRYFFFLILSSSLGSFRAITEPRTQYAASFRCHLLFPGYFRTLNFDPEDGGNKFLRSKKKEAYFLLPLRLRRLTKYLCQTARRHIPDDCTTLKWDTSFYSWTEERRSLGFAQNEITFKQQ
jgi:hypothetical protein